MQDRLIEELGIAPDRDLSACPVWLRVERRADELEARLGLALP